MYFLHQRKSDCLSRQRGHTESPKSIGIFPETESLRVPPPASGQMQRRSDVSECRHLDSIEQYKVNSL